MKKTRLLKRVPVNLLSQTVGVRVEPKKESFVLYMTGGTENKNEKILMGTVRRSETDGTLQFFAGEL